MNFCYFDVVEVAPSSDGWGGGVGEGVGGGKCGGGGMNQVIHQKIPTS